MWLQARSTAHEGTSPAGAMVTPFPFPCGRSFLNEQYQQDEAMRQRCAPPGFEDYWWSSAGYYSPAICPQGYTAGCFRWNSEQGPAVEPTETAVQCVPSGYVCNTMHISMAYSYSQTAPMIQIRWAETDLSSFATHPLFPGANPTNHELRGDGIEITRAPGVVARQAVSGGFDSFGSFGSDFSQVPSATHNTVTTTRPTTREPSTTGSGDGDGGSRFPKFTETGSAQSDDGGLSTGTKTGIGVGVAVGVLLLLGALAFFLWRRRKQTAQATGQTPPADIPHPNMTELEQGGKFELPAGQTTASPTVVGSELGGSTPVPIRGAVLDKDGNAELATHGLSPATVRGSELSGSSPWHGHAGTPGWVPELHGQERPPYSELHPDSRPVEMDSTQPPPAAISPIPRKQVASPAQQQQTPSPWQAPSSPADSGPDTRVSIMPARFGHSETTVMEQQPAAEPSAQELAALQEQHAQLESRRQRILELEQIERDQAALQQRMETVRGGGASRE